MVERLRCERCGELLPAAYLVRDDDRPFCFLCVDDEPEECSEEGKYHFYLVDRGQRVLLV